MTEQTNETKAKAIIESVMPDLWMLKEEMDKINMLEVDLLRALYLIENIQRVSRWGKVIISIKDGEIVSVTGENNFISENELKRNLKMYKNR